MSAAAPPTWSLSSVAVGRDGTIFVSADLADVIYRIAPSRGDDPGSADRAPLTGVREADLRSALNAVA